MANFDYVAGHYYQSTDKEVIQAGFLTLEAAQEYVEGIDILGTGFSYVDTPDGKYIYGYTNAWEVESKWYAPEQWKEALVYDVTEDRVVEVGDMLSMDKYNAIQKQNNPQKVEEELQTPEIDTVAFVKEHEDYLKELRKNAAKSTVVINAFGGAGAGKTTACLGIVEELKKKGFIAEYVQEYAKDLVWEENWEMLDGSQKHQFEILKEQMKRMDRLYGKVDFIVTDAPILLNKVYNKELTPEYESMLQQINGQYANFNFVVERNPENFEQQGRMQNLKESMQKDNEIKEMLKTHGLYFGTYNHKRVPMVIDNAVTTLQKLQHRMIAGYLKRNGFQPTKSLVDNVAKLDKLTGRKNYMNDIKNLYQNIERAESEEVKECVQQIGKECEMQELEKLQMPAIEM